MDTTHWDRIIEFALSGGAYTNLLNEQLEEILLIRGLGGSDLPRRFSPDFTEVALVILRSVDEVEPAWLAERVTDDPDFTSFEGWEMIIWANFHHLEIPFHISSSAAMTRYYLSFYLVHSMGRKGSRARWQCTPKSSSERSWRSAALAYFRQYGVKDYLYSSMPNNCLSALLLGGKESSFPPFLLSSYEDRYRALNTSPFLEQISLLYDLEERTAAHVAGIYPPHPLEEIILGLEKGNSLQVAEDMGIVVPRYHSSDPNRYIAAAISAYKAVLTRSLKREDLLLERLEQMEMGDLERLLFQLTDREILDGVIGIEVPYRSREELIRKVAQCLRRPTFFVPARRHLPERSRNQFTMLYGDVSDPNLFIVAYGTPSSYYSYELTELKSSCHQREESGIWTFLHPESPLQQFTPSEAQALQELLLSYPLQEEIRALLERLSAFFASQEESIEIDREVQAWYGRIIEKGAVEEFLLELFNLAMYMRRWEGPGHPYPLERESTTKEIDPQPQSLSQIGKCVDILEKMKLGVRKFVMALPMIEYRGESNFTYGGGKLKEIWNAVLEGRYCIRMASSVFATIANHYLRVLCGKTIPGFDRRKMDRIA